VWTGYVKGGVASWGMKKQLADQQFHDRRHQERKRAEAARKPVKKKVEGGESVAEEGKSSARKS